MEQQVESTQDVQATSTPTPVDEQAQSTESQEAKVTEEPKVEESVDLSKLDLSQATPEQLAEIQKGYMRQSDYTKKTQEVAEQRKQEPDFAEMVQSEKFLNWAKEMGLVGQSVEQQKTQANQEPEFMQSLTDEQKQAVQFYFQKLATPYIQAQQQQTVAQQDEKLTGKYGNEIVTPNVLKSMNSLQTDVLKHKGALFREETFKIADYDSAIKRSYEQGRQEGLKGKQIRQDVNTPESTNNVTNTQSRVYDESDKPTERLTKIFDDAQKKHGAYQGTGTISPRNK